MATKRLEGLFAEALAAGMPAAPAAGSWVHSLDKFNILDRSVPIQAPERAHPAPDAQLAPSWASLQSVRERLLRAVATVDGRDLTAVGAPHPSSARSTATNGSSPSPSTRNVTSANCERRCQRHNLGGKPFHLLQLRTALEQQESDARFLELVHTLGHLFRCADQPCAQPAIRNG